MNQRSSHFTMGSSSVPYGSVYAKDYVAKQSTKQQTTQQNPFRGTSLQHNNAKSSFVTTNKSLMQNWGQVQHAKLDPKKLQNLRGHHFTLGNYNPGTLNTSHKIFYDRKQINNQASNKQQQSKIKMRMHNHDFKQQNWTNFQSSYANQYGSHQNTSTNTNKPNNHHQGGNAIVLGNHQIPMITTNALNYTQKKVINDGSQNNQKALLQQTSALVLGNTNTHEPMETINQHYFTSKPIQPNHLPEATMKQLRSTHFNLGTMKQSYNTESKLYQSFNGAPGGKFQIPSYESGTWVDKQAKFNALTTNQRQLPERSVQPYKKHQGRVKGGFQLGSSTNNYETQFKKNFIERGDLDVRAPNAKKPDNIVIGLDKGSYVTQQRANFKDRDLKQAKTNSASIKAMNTEDHFQIGGSSNQAQLTTYQDQYRKDVQNKNKMFHNTKK